MGEGMRHTTCRLSAGRPRTKNLFEGAGCRSSSTTGDTNEEKNLVLGIDARGPGLVAVRLRQWLRFRSGGGQQRAKLFGRLGHRLCGGGGFRPAGRPCCARSRFGLPPGLQGQAVQQLHGGGQHPAGHQGRVRCAQGRWHGGGCCRGRAGRAGPGRAAVQHHRWQRLHDVLRRRQQEGGGL